MLMLSKNYSNKLSLFNYLALLLFVFWLPLKENYLPIILALWIITWLIEANFVNKLRNFNNKYFYLGFVSYFLLTSLAFFTSKSVETGLFEIQQKLSMLFFPLFLFSSNDEVKKKLNIILIVFILGNLVASFYCLINALLQNLVFEDGKWILKHWLWEEYKVFSFWELINQRHSHFSYRHLSILIHPAYFAMYINFSICILIYLYKNNVAKTILIKILMILCLLFFILIIYMLQSSAGFLTFGIISFIAFLIELKEKSKKRYLLFGVLVLIIGLVVIFSSKPTVKRINDYTEIILEANKSDLFNKDDRLGFWYSSIEVIKDNFWFGVTPANLTDELTEIYIRFNIEDAINEKYNSHNQYFESFAGLGIFGFISLMFIIIYSFFISIKKRHYLLFFLMVILSINFLFESMLNRMAGVLFMMFFISLFVFAKNDETSSEETIQIREE